MGGAQGDAKEAPLTGSSAAQDAPAELAAILGQLAEGVIVADLAGCITFVNEAAARIHGVAELGVDPDRYTDTNHLLTEDGRPYPPHELPLARVVASGIATGEERWRIQRPDGTIVLAVGAARPVFGSDGERIGTVLTLRDETAREAAESAYRESTERFSIIFDQVQVGICETNLDGTLRAANPAISRILGYTPDELAGVSFAELSHPEDRAAALARFRSLLAGEITSYQAEQRYIAKDGRAVWTSVQVSIVRDDAGEPLYALSTIQDITERKEDAAAILQLNASLEQRIADALAERERMEEQLVQMQKLKAVGQLAGGVAHDFNNLLAAVVGNLDILSRKIEPGSPFRRYVESALKGADRGAQLTRQLLSFARKQRLSTRPVNVNPLLQGTVTNLLSRTLGGRIEVDFLPGENLWPAAIDPAQLESAILNLAVNSRDAMAEGGLLTIETSNVRITGASEADVEPGDYVLITVTDTGCGMAADVAARATEPFFTTKQVGQGTGLGLSTVYGFLRQSGGTMRITSHIGQGTSIQLYLPRSATSPVDDRATNSGSEIRAKGEIVLVVDDDEGARSATSALLGELGYAVIEAPGGARALEIINANADINLLVTDYAMPGINGAELIDRARSVRHDLKAIVVTGYAQGSELDRMLSVKAVLRKPFNLAELSSALAHAQ